MSTPVTPEKIDVTKMVRDKNDPLDFLIPASDLPVDPDRLKRAIKTALIKNDNNPDKIDIKSIMREQTRIHKHIEEYKASRRPDASEAGGQVSKNYFSSHIFKKIAEDKIHNRIMEICEKKDENALEFNP